MGPSVDIIIPTNRNSSYLSDTLVSVHQQTFTDYAVIVVDDGSPDEAAMRDLVREFPFVQLIRRPHEGVSAARNAGIRATSAPLVVFLDDDDLWEPKRLEKQVEALRETPEAVACYSGGYHVGPDGARWDDSVWPGDQHSRVEFLRGAYPIPRINTLMIRREALCIAGEFDVRLRMAQDKDMTLRLLQLGEMVGVNEPLVGYRRHPGNVTHNAEFRGRAYSDAMIRRQLNSARRRHDAAMATLLSQYLKSFRADQISYAVRRTNLFLSERRIRDAVGEIGWALRRSPGRTARCVVAESAARLRVIDSATLEQVRHAPSAPPEGAADLSKPTNQPDGIVGTVWADLWVACHLWDAKSRIGGLLRVLYRVLLVPHVRAVIIFRLAQSAYRTPGLRFLGYLLRARIMRVVAADIHPAARIGPGFTMAHSVGVVIGQDVVAGRDLAVFQNVTLGDRGNPPGQPVIGNRVTVGAGAKVLGSISIGDGAIIGANSVVLSDVPAYATVVGAPARVVSQGSGPAPAAPDL